MSCKSCGERKAIGPDGRSSNPHIPWFPDPFCKQCNWLLTHTRGTDGIKRASCPNPNCPKFKQEVASSGK